MNAHPRKLLLIPLLILVIGFRPALASDEDQSEEAAIRDTVERIMVAAGNYNEAEMRALASWDALISYTYFRDGEWLANEMSLSDYFADLESRTLRPYTEIVHDYDIHVSEGRVALVKADAVVNRFGVPGKREVNNMLLMKVDDQWKLMGISWSVHELPAAELAFDRAIFARGYAQVWGSRRPDFVAQFFAEDGVLQVNDGAPAEGREAIAEVAAAFMTDLPDMRVRFDRLVQEGDKTVFHWTLLATNSGPNGNGNPIEVSGYEVWEFSEDNLIRSSQGHFPSEEYARQMGLTSGAEMGESE